MAELIEINYRYDSTLVYGTIAAIFALLYCIIAHPVLSTYSNFYRSLVSSISFLGTILLFFVIWGIIYCLSFLSSVLNGVACKAMEYIEISKIKDRFDIIWVSHDSKERKDRADSEKAKREKLINLCKSTDEYASMVSDARSEYSTYNGGENELSESKTSDSDEWITANHIDTTGM